MQIKALIRLTKGMAIASAALYTGPVQAAGFALIEQGVKGLGTAFAGSAAIAEDATTLFFNPAGLTRLEGQQILIAGHVIVPVADFKNRGSTNAIGGQPTGRLESSAGVTGFVPNFYYTTEVTDRLNLGLGITVPFGLTTEYDRDWIGRYHAVNSELLTVNINPTVAYRLSEALSIGAGVSAQYIDVTLSNAIDFGTLAFLGGVPGALPSTPALDGFTEVEGDDWGYGFNLGLLYEIDSDSRIGIAYRSKISHTIEGTNQITIPAALAGIPPFGSSRSRSASADTTLPETVSISGYHGLTDRWAIMADASWTRWSRFDELRIQFSDGSETVQPEDWENSWRYSVGVSYAYSSAWTLRAGIAYDETPIPSAELRTPRIADNSRRWIALGASYRFSPRLSLDIGYAHLFVSDPRIINTEVTTGERARLPIGSTLDGKYEAEVDIFSAQVQWDF